MTREKTHVHRWLRTAVTAGLIALTLLPGGVRARTGGAVVAGGLSLAELPGCSDGVPTGGGGMSPAWLGLLDDEGALVGHELRLATPDGTIGVRLGARAFVTEAVGGWFVVGEREAGRTRLALVDAALGCRAWSRTLAVEAYDVRLEPGGDSILFVAIDPGSRAARGTYRLRLDGAAEAEDIAEPCQAACEATDGLDPAVVPTLSDPQPVPVYPGGRWPLEAALRFRWYPDAEPPTWARPAIKSAAEDASTTRRSNAPTYAHDPDASDTIRYTASFPYTCRYGIACASRNLPSWWTVRLRPHGTDFSWGTLRWCQKLDTDGCFDIERTMLHELGHVNGLGHPDDAGFRLAASQTVMNAVIPAKPKAGSGMHAFGSCDVASLQRVYDTPGPSAAISQCLDLATRLTLQSSADRVVRGDSVRLKAGLSVATDDSYGMLAGNPLRGRSVRLRYRPAGSSDAWTTVWMADGENAGNYVVTLAVSRALEFQAVFRRPDDEGLRGETSRLVTVDVTNP